MMALNFLVEVCLSLTVSIFALIVLKGALQNILTDLCQGKHRAEFWTRFTLVMLVIGPLLGTVLFDNSLAGDISVTDFREVLRNVLLGAFATLSGIGFVIWSYIPRRDSNRRPTFADRMPTPD